MLNSRLASFPCRSVCLLGNPCRASVLSFLTPQATLHNSATSEDAKAHAEDVLREGATLCLG